MHVSPRRLSLALVGGLFVACSSEAPAPIEDGVRVAVAPLTLPSLSKVCYDLRVTNAADGAGDVVWSKGTPGLNGGTPDGDAICSTEYGNLGGGDITYIGPCDADGQEDADPAGERTNSVTIWFDGLYDQGGAYLDPAGASGWQNPCVDATGAEVGCTLNTLCEENADALVEFNFTILREANQGFFDVAVNFGDIFCSAKFDCSYASEGVCSGAGGACTTGTLIAGKQTCDTDADCVVQDPIDLLHNGDGERDRTFVLGFACTAGPGTDVETELYLNDLELDCGGDGDTNVFTPDFTLSTAGLTDGNQCTAGAMSGCSALTTHGESLDPDDYFFQYAIYKGDEALTNGATSEPANKKYWNLALGVKPAIAGCQIRTAGTAEDANDPDDLVADRLIAPGTVYPFIRWDVDAATCTQEPLSFAGGINTLALSTMTMVGYPPPSHPGIAFKNAASSRLPQATQCGPSRPCLDGFRCTSSGTCESTDGQEILIPAGTFWMGCNAALNPDCATDEIPQHHVTLSEYAIDKHEVTAREYEACVAAGACSYTNTSIHPYMTYQDASKASHPILGINWSQAEQYCAWSGKPGGAQTLCTEAQWERAARGGCETLSDSTNCRQLMRTFPWDGASGEALRSPDCSLANFAGCTDDPATIESYDFSLPVGFHSPAGDSPYGVQDMAGNAKEWVADFYGIYSWSPIVNPTGAATGPFRVTRGGDLANADFWLSTSRRFFALPDQDGTDFWGFRCCRPCEAGPSFALGASDTAPVGARETAAVWSPAPNGTTLTQSANSVPSIYTTNLDVVGADLEFTLRTNDSDNDQIGWTVGHRLNDLSPLGSAGDRDYLLFAWKAEPQLDLLGQIFLADQYRPAGLELSRVTGPVTGNTGAVGDLWSPATVPPAGRHITRLASAMTLGNVPYARQRAYLVRMVYSTTRVQVWVDGQLQFDQSTTAGAPFPSGNLGFFVFSQGKTSFKLVRVNGQAPNQTCD